MRNNHLALLPWYDVRWVRSAGSPPSPAPLWENITPISRCLIFLFITKYFIAKMSQIWIPARHKTRALPGWAVGRRVQFLIVMQQDVHASYWSRSKQTSAVRYRTRKEKLRHVFLKTVFQSVYTMFIRSAKSVYILELFFKKPATF